MSKLSFDVYLDESGNFENDASQWALVSMVGGLLVPTHEVPDRVIQELVRERIHAKEAYDHEAYFGILRKLVNGMKGRFVIFNNEERISVINGDFTYLNVISEGIVQLVRKLKIQYPDDEIYLHILIAWRQAVAYKRDQQIPDNENVRIQQDEYFARIEEKLIIALGRSKVHGIDWDIRFDTGDVNKRLMLADLICFTWRFRNSKDFSEAEKAEIGKLAENAYVFSVFENAAVGSLRRLLIEERYEEMLYQLCNLRKLGAASQVGRELISRMKAMTVRELEALLNYMSLQFGRLNDLHLLTDGILLALNFKERILSAMEDSHPRLREALAFSRFDTDFYLLTMYDHLGDVAKARHYLDACEKNISAVNHSLEHIEYYFRFRIRALNVLIDHFAFEEVLRQSDELVTILTEARELFSLIQTFNGSEHALQSESLGKVYGIRVEAMINLLHNKPGLLREAEADSDHALAEFTHAIDLGRQEQWRCMLMVEAGRSEEAIQWLLRVPGVQNAEKPFDAFTEAVYRDLYRGRDYPLWHYTNVMLLLKREGDSRAEAMRQALMNQAGFRDDLQDEIKSGHPWNLVLWNLARYERLNGSQDAYLRHYRRALAITRDSKAVTVMTYLLSMSADRLLWCREHGTPDTREAQNEFAAICRDMQKAGMTEEMRKAFRMDELDSKKTIVDETLQLIADSWLR